MKNNYYTIHKNKKKRKVITNKQMEALRIVNRVLKNAIFLTQKMIELSKQNRRIPNYIKGGVHKGNLAIVNDGIISKEVLEWKEEIHDIPTNIGCIKNSYHEFKNRTFEM